MYDRSIMNPQERLLSEIKESLKAKQSERVSTLRMLLSEIKNEKIKTGQEVDDDAFVGLVRRAIKQRKEAAVQYRQGARQELADKEDREAEILAVYLPKQAAEADIRRAIEELVAAEGLSGPKGIGPVMKAMLARFGGSADGATINRLAREILTSS